jgi:hypothetical protein
MFASKVSRSPSRFDISSRPEPRDSASLLPRLSTRTSDEDRRKERSRAPGHVSLTGPMPAPSTPVAPPPAPSPAPSNQAPDWRPHRPLGSRPDQAQVRALPARRRQTLLCRARDQPQMCTLRRGRERHAKDVRYFLLQLILLQLTRPSPRSASARPPGPALSRTTACRR